MPTAWNRLKQYVKQNELQITNLRLEFAGQQAKLLPYRDENGDPQLKGYWQVKKMRKFVFQGGQIERIWRGIGYLTGNKLCITWITQDGKIVPEIRDYDASKEGVIFND
jgi:hypothetical protein